MWKEWLDKKNSRGQSYRGLFPALAKQIIGGIEHGIDIDFTGDREVSRDCVNLKSALEKDKIEKVDKIIQEDVRKGKKAGPFDGPPFAHFSISPIGAVTKRNSSKVRVIHHLSHPRGKSVNDAIRDVYQPMGSLDEAADFIQQCGPGCLLIKLDIEAAYKQVPVRKEDWPLLGFKWNNK